MRRGQPERRTHDYRQQASTDLFAALDVQAGTVIGRCTYWHRSVEFRAFLYTVSRRRWSDAERDRILAEATAPGAVISVVARRHGMSPQHLFTWLRAARRSAASLPVALPLTFVPALVEGDVPDPAAQRSRPRALHRDAPAAEIELDLAGVTVRIGAGAREASITAVIRALEATV